jgi:two-component system, NarL family, nitrate/nitrite response regulator NarL
MLFRKVGTVRTLVVDDSEVSLRTICSFLSAQPGIELVATANGGEQALQLARKLHPQLVFMDVQMPKMNGIDATLVLTREQPAVNVIIVTVHDTPELRQACFEAGARCFVSKHRLAQELPTLLRCLQDCPTSENRVPTGRSFVPD